MKIMKQSYLSDYNCIKIRLINIKMFDLCKKVEIYNIENHYYYLGGQAINPQQFNNNHPNLIKPNIISTLGSPNKPKTKYTKKGIRLSKTLNEIPQIKIQNRYQNLTQHSFLKAKPKQIMHNQLPTYSPSIPLKNHTSWAETAAVSQNQHLLASLYSMNNFSNRRQSIQSGNDLSHIQKIKTKSKPVSPLVCHTDQDRDSIKIQIQHKASSSQHDVNKNLSQTKPPISSKIQTSYTNDIYSSDKLNPRFDALNQRSMGESMQYSSQKIISISKSVSSMHQQMKESNRLRNTDFGFDERYRNSSNQLSVNFSNIFSKQQNLESDRKKSVARDSILKKLSLWQDSDRHTIQSKFSRELDITQEFEVKIQQSFIYEHDLKSNFNMLQQNKIIKKDYIVSQAIEVNLNCAVSLKQFLVHDMKLIVQQLQTYEILQNCFSQKQEYHNVLELYQVQLSDNQHILIKQPYTMTMQAKLKTCNQNQQTLLRQKAKDVASTLIGFLSGFGYYPTRKITTHQFVICIEEPKLHDLSIFKPSKEPHLTNEQILAGLDI